MSGWPAEKWLALPIVAFVGYGIIIAVGSAALEDTGWYDEFIASHTQSWGDY